MCIFVCVNYELWNWTAGLNNWSLSCCIITLSVQVLALRVYPAGHAHQVPNMGGDLALEERIVPAHHCRLEDVRLEGLLYNWKKDS